MERRAEIPSLEKLELYRQSGTFLPPTELVPAFFPLFVGLSGPLSGLCLGRRRGGGARKRMISSFQSLGTF